MNRPAANLTSHKLYSAPPQFCEAMLHDIEQAERYIYLEMYKFGNDEVGARFARVISAEQADQSAVRNVDLAQQHQRVFQRLTGLEIARHAADALRLLAKHRDAAADVAVVDLPAVGLRARDAARSSVFAAFAMHGDVGIHKAIPNRAEVAVVVLLHLARDAARRLLQSVDGAESYAVLHVSVKPADDEPAGREALDLNVQQCKVTDIPFPGIMPDVAEQPRVLLLHALDAQI